MNTDPVTDFIQKTERRYETHERTQHTQPSKKRLFGGRRVLGDSLGALRHGVLGKLARQDQSDAANKSVDWNGCEKERMTYEVWISRDEMVDFLL